MEFDWSAILTTILSSSAVSTAAFFILKHFYLNELKKDIENHKHLLQIDIIKAQLQSKEAINTYQELFQQLEVSYGAMANLVSPLRFKNSFQNYNDSDVENLLRENDATELKITEICDLFRNNDPNKANALNDYLEELKLHTSFNKQSEAKNFAITKALYLSEDIEEQVFKILKSISGCNISYQTGVNHGDRTLCTKAYQESEPIREEIDSLKKQMRNSLTPKAMQ